MLRPCRATCNMLLEYWLAASKRGRNLEMFEGVAAQLGGELAFALLGLDSADQAFSGQSVTHAPLGLNQVLSQGGITDFFT